MVIRDTIITLVLKLVGSGLWLAYSVLLARALAPDDFGLVFYVINFVLFAGPVCSMGFESASLRFGSQYWEKGDHRHYKSLLWQARFSGLVGTILCGIGLTSAYWLGVHDPISRDPWLIAMTLIAVALYTMMGLHRDMLRSAGRIVSAQMGVNILRAIVPLIASFIAWKIGALTVELALAFYIAALGLSVLFELWRFSTLELSMAPEHAAAKHRRRVANKMWPGDLFNAAITRADVIVVGATLGLESAALYIAAQRLAVFAEFTLDAVRTAAGPELARSFLGGVHSERFRSVTGQVSALYATTGFIGAVAIAILGVPVLAVFGPLYVDAYPILLVLIIARMSLAFFGPVSLIANLTGLELTHSVVTAICALSLVTLVTLGGLFGGGIGAALGACAANWLNGLLLALAIRRWHGIWIGLLSRSTYQAMMSFDFTSLLNSRRALRS